MLNYSVETKIQLFVISSHTTAQKMRNSTPYPNRSYSCPHFIVSIRLQVFFKRQLSGIQWVSLGVLTLGCVVKQLGKNTITEQDYLSSVLSEVLSWKLLLMIIQVSQWNPVRKVTALGAVKVFY